MSTSLCHTPRADLHNQESVFWWCVCNSRPALAMAQGGQTRRDRVVRDLLPCARPWRAGGKPGWAFARRPAAVRRLLAAPSATGADFGPGGHAPARRPGGWQCARCGRAPGSGRQCFPAPLAQVNRVRAPDAQRSGDAGSPAGVLEFARPASGEPRVRSGAARQWSLRWGAGGVPRRIPERMKSTGRCAPAIAAAPDFFLRRSGPRPHCTSRSEHAAPEWLGVVLSPT